MVQNHPQIFDRQLGCGTILPEELFLYGPIFGTENSIQLARFRAVALAEDTLLCKAKQQRSRWSSANPEAHIAYGLAAEALF
jgi:hypothetical protein